MAVRGDLWRVLAMISWSGTFWSPRLVAAEWRSWYSSSPSPPLVAVYWLSRTPCAVVAQADPAGVGQMSPGLGLRAGTVRRAARDRMCRLTGMDAG
jgi:hypothetical protein